MKHKGNGKRAVSWLLTLVLLIGLLPMPTAEAADTTLTEGNIYYFDLSGASIPGEVTPNLPNGDTTNLPDTSLHYVPFTYVGSVNAYVLNENSTYLGEAPEAASQATESSATYGYTYDHSLFVADCVVTHTVSWNTLKDNGLIFGKNNYRSGGITYSLRAPSMGKDYIIISETRYGDPTNNEWDAIQTKNIDYIKNRHLFSWGQDSWVDTDYYGSTWAKVSIRGTRTSSALSVTGSAEDWRYGFRPVLEVPNTVTLDSAVKVVTLKLNGGTLGGSSDDIQIIVKNGASFTAPASDGLTHPGGNNINTYFRWRDDDGNLYEPSDTVPSTVTTLTAVYPDPPELTIDEPGTITYDGEAVTVSKSDLGSATDLTYTCQAETDGEVAVTAAWYADNSGVKGAELSNGAPTDAGTYWLVLTTPETTTYGVGSWSKRFTISKAEWTDKSTTVSERPDVEATVDLADLIAPGGQLGSPSENGSMLTKCSTGTQELVYQIKSNAAENDTTTVTIPVTNATNYNNYDITVTVKALAKSSIPTSVLNAITGYSGTYDGTAHDAVVKGDAVTSDYTLTYSDSENGTYLDTKTVKDVADSGPVWVKVSRPGYADAKTSVSVTVTAKDITDATITLGTQKTYTGKSQDVVISSVKVSGITAALVKGQDYTITSGGSATNVEETELTITGTGNFTGTATATARWTLVKAAPTNAGYLALPDLSEAKTYSGSPISVNAPTAASGKTGLGTVTVYYAGSGYSKSTQAPTNAGTYTVTFDVAEGTNYKAASDLSIGTLTISKKQVTVTANNKTAFEGGSAPSLANPVEGTDYTVKGLVGSDELTGTVTLAYQKDGSPVTPNMNQPGSYDIVPSGGTVGTNYTIRYVNGTLIVGGIVLPGKDGISGNEDDVTVKPATGDTVITDNGDGSYHVGTPGGTVVRPNETITVSGEFDVKNDGTVILPSSTATVDGETVKGPATIKADGTVEGAGVNRGADVNGDGVVNLDDALEILNYVLEIGSEYIK